MTPFIAGLMMGGLIGALAVCLCVVGRSEDEKDANPMKEEG